MKKKFISYIMFAAASMTFGGMLTSCTDYLDKSPDSDVDATAVYKNFTNFQGFIEQNYNCIPNKESNYWCCTFNWGEDEIMNAGLGDSHETHQFDLGNYRYWYQDPQSFLHANPDDLNPNSTDKFHHSLEHAWYCIRVCNKALSYLDKFTNASTSEKEVIKGQALFFRAWWHEQLMEFYGGVPYVTTAYESSDVLDLPRLSFKECALKCAEDFREAAKLLPNNWDAGCPAGLTTKGHNDLRITKVCALAYCGKVLLWAASPLHVHGAQIGGAKLTYSYDKELAAQAADALAEALSLVDSGKTPYKLATFDYSDIYNHISNSTNSFTEIFYTTGRNWQMPGGTEAIMRGCVPDVNGTNWNFAKLWGPKVNNLVEHDAVIHMPTANYVNYAYGMANGEPAYIVENGKLVPNPTADDGADGKFNPSQPFNNRDPRFYHDIMFDGFKFINGDPDEANKCYQYLPLHSPLNTTESSKTTDLMRSETQGSRTGYFCQKLIPHQANKFDGMYNWGGALQAYLPYLRLADVYLMFAECGAAISGANYTNDKWPGKDACYAIDVLRQRVGCAKVLDKYKEGTKFMDEVRRERACELAFEGFRWNDLQRWLLLSEAPYNQKTSQEFQRADPNYDFSKKDPREARVVGFTEKVIVKRDYLAKHYFFPFKIADVSIYSEFKQNPGWE